MPVKERPGENGLGGWWKSSIYSAIQKRTAYIVGARNRRTRKRHVTILHIPPVISPETAVRAAIIQEYRNARTKQVGRPTLPKGAAKGRIVPVRFTAESLRVDGNGGKDAKTRRIRVD